ncbi:MAG: spore germination protein [Bacillota bacterium]
MFKLLQKFLQRRKKRVLDDWRKNPDISMREVQVRQVKLFADLDKNLQMLTRYAGPSFDVSVRRFTAAGKSPAALVRLDGLVDSRTVEEILRNLMVESRMIDEPGKRGEIKSAALERLLTIAEVREADNIADLFSALSIGNIALLFDGAAQALLCNAKGFLTRAITEPGSEMALRGPREGFIESLRANTSLIRRRIRIPHLWIESLVIGELTQTEVAFAYIKGLAAEKMLREVKDRLGRIKIDGVLESGYLEEFISDTPWTLFPLAQRTERPDIVASSLLEGRVAIFTDGSPHALVVPSEITTLLQAPDDYYEKSPAGSFIRLLRFGAILISLLLPGIYVAVINFHQELLPTALLLRVTAAREGVPFPVIFEVLLMEILFEVLREAGIRLPAAIGPAISIVGALILGDAAIRAGLVSPAVVIVIALTAIASFATPVFSLAIALRILRFLFTVAGAVFGLFGVQLVLFATVIHLCSLRSFGIPYMSPLAPFIWGDMKDALTRAFWWRMRRRPKLIGGQEPQRAAPDQLPLPGRDPGERTDGEKE